MTNYPLQSNLHTTAKWAVYIIQLWNCSAQTSPHGFPPLSVKESVHTMASRPSILWPPTICPPHLPLFLLLPFSSSHTRFFVTPWPVKLPTDSGLALAIPLAWKILSTDTWLTPLLVSHVHSHVTLSEKPSLTTLYKMASPSTDVIL